MRTLDSVKKTNRAALLLAVAALILCIVFMLFPAYEITSAVYSKKSANTFIGDEKYQEAMAEATAVKEQFEAEGMEVVLDESTIERTNSKGETTSMLVLTLTSTFMKSAMDFLGAGLNSSWVLLGMLLCIALAIALMTAGSLGTLDVSWNYLDKKNKSFRSAACVMLLVAALLVPVFFMTNTYDLSRRVTLYSGGLIEAEGMDAFYEKLNQLLFDGTAGGNIETFLKGLEFRVLPWMWLTLPCILAMLTGAIQLRYGTIKHAVTKGLLYAFVALVCIITLYPYYVMLVTGFRSSAETNDMYFLHILPTKWVFSNLKNIIDRGVLKYLLNSLMIAGGATAIALFCGIPAAYAMARMRFKGKNAFLGFVIMSQMFSPVVLLIGIAQLMSTLSLNDSIIGLMLINAAFNQAFAIWLLRGTFVSISPEMEQAGRIDGCTTLGSLWHILLPMAAPGIVTTLIFVFINAWNEYTISTVLISSAVNRPITVGITQFSSFNMIEWQYLFAASLLATIPVVILFMCIEKHLTAGLTSGGVKG